MTHRYYFPDLPPAGGQITLTGGEAHHAIHVMRIRVGQWIEIFDGQGSQSRALVDELDRGACHCTAETPQVVNREPMLAVHLAVALPKPDRARELIERLTELGVKTVTPLVAARTQRPPSKSLLEKLRRGVIEACKQCRRNHLLQIMPTDSAETYFAASRAGTKWIAHPSGDPGPLLAPPPSDEVCAAVGPEGGWTNEEVRLAIENGFDPISMGTRVYRVETAATAIAAVLVIR